MIYVAGSSNWGGQMQGNGPPMGGGGGSFGNNYQQGYGGGAVRSNYQPQRATPYSKFQLLM